MSAEHINKVFIQALEQRIMLDGAAASSILDVVESQNVINLNEVLKQNQKENLEPQLISQDPAVSPLERSGTETEKRNIVFIDSQVTDYDQIINTFKEGTEVHIIDANENGFEKMASILQDQNNVDGIHIIGHGSAGQILFGNAFLNNDTITNYQATLASIGQSLTTSGDILFYGCNVASTDQGELLIKKISEITKADIAASDDITGKSGDWELEKKIGIIETRNVQVLDYQSDLLQDGISSLSSIGEYTGTDLRKGQGNESNIQIKLENQNLNLSSTDYVGEFPINSSLSFRGSNDGYISSSSSNFSHPNGHYETLQNATGSSASANVNSYIVFLRSSNNRSGSITFDGEILGIFLTPELIVGQGNINNKYSGFGSREAGATYITNIFDNTYENTSLTYESGVEGGYVLENNSTSSNSSSITYRYGNTGNINSSYDRIAVTSSGGTNNKLSVSMSNGSGGDYIRVIVKQPNSAPTASDGTVYINENNQVSSAGDRTPSNITKVFAASDFNFSDSDGGSLSKIQITSLESSGDLEYSTNGSTWSDVTTNLEISAANLGNGYLRFTPTSNSESDVTFGFKVHDGEDYSSSAYTMNISVNAAPNVTDTTIAGNVSAGATTTSADIHDIVLDNDDNDSVLVVTGVAAGNESSNNTIVTDATGVGSAVSGTYGSLTVAADGTYTYTASASNNISNGSTATDTFTFTTRDDETNAGSFAYDVGTITFTVASSGSAPVAVNDTDSITEGLTLTVKADENDVLNDDTDADSDSLTVTFIGTGSNSDQAVAASSSYNSNGTAITGTYGTLTIGADGSYTYAATESAANAISAGSFETDTFTYTISDGNGGTDTATLIITINGANDAPTATADTGYIQEGKTLTVADGASANDADSSSNTNDATGDHTGDILGNDTDPDTNDTLTVTTYSHTSSTGQGGAAGGSNSNSGTAGTNNVVGDYGTLDLEANGSYTYTANSDITNLDVDDETFTDVFTYTLSDGTTTTTATITITIEASGDVTAQDDTGTVNEDGTLTVSNDGNTASVDAATYDPSPFSVNSQEVTQGFTFNNDGTKMFTTGTVGDDINEYNLSTAFDVSTATFNDINGNGTGFSVGAQDTMPMDVSFNNDGTKMFVLGYYNKDVNEYTLTTGFDVSTASFVDSFSVGSQDSENHGLTFNNDGTKMFVVGNQGDDINEYTLSTGFDVSTASYTQNFSVSAQDTSPMSLTFNNDGTKMFVVGDQGNDINEYTLSTGFDVSTASFVGEFSVSSQDLNPYDIEFNNDGTKLFLLGSQEGDISEYSLTTPFSLVDVTGENTGDVIDTSSSSNQDSDADSDPLTITAIRTGSSEGSGTAGTVGDALTGTYGQLTIASDGSYTYVANQALADALDPGDVVTDAFNYTVSDGNGEDDFAVLTITVVGINDTPSADNETGAVNEDAILTVSDGTSDVLHGDTDVDDSSSLTVTTYSHTSATAVGGGSASTGNGNSNTAGSGTVVGYYGTLTLAADGTYTYAADQDTADALDATVDTVTDVFTYTVSDGNGGTDTATITITITGVNDAPVADDETNSTNVSTTLTVNDGSDDVLTGDTDADGSSSLTVTGIRIGQEGGSGTAGTVGDALTGTYGTLTIASDGTYSYVAGSSAGTDYFTYTVSDGTATDTAQITITVNPLNSAPTASNSTVYINENNQVSSAGDRTPSNITKVFAASDFNFSDSDGGSLSKIQITTLESSGDLEYSTNGSTWSDVTTNLEISAANLGNGYLRFTPTANSESDVTFGFKVHDGEDYSSSAYTMNISVNAAPNVTDTTVAGTVAAGATTSSADIHTIVADSDDDDSVLVVTGVAAGDESSNNTIITNNTGVGSAVSGMYGSLTVAADGTYTYTASATNNIAFGATATDIFTFTTRDDESNSGSNAYDVGTITFTVASSISLVADTDAVAEDGTVTHLTNSAGTVISDDAADTNGLVVTNISHTNGNSDTIESGSTYTDSGGEPGSVVGTYGTLKIGADGTYTYTADQAAADALDLNDPVTDVFTYTADGATATLTINVTGINDAPVAQDDVGVVNEDGLLPVSNDSNASVTGSFDAHREHSGDVIDTSSASHTDSDADASASLTITAVRTGDTEGDGTAGSVGSGLAGTYGTLTLNSTGSYAYVADLDAADAIDDGETVVDSFNYTVSDGTATDIAVIRITILGANDAPTAVNDTDTATEGSATTVTGSEDDVLNDDSDVDVETITVTNISHTNGNDESVTASTTYSNGQSIAGTYGTLVIGADGSYEFTPNDVLGASETGNDVFTYTVSDGTATSTATLTITTTGANDAPVADNETGAVNEDATLTVSDGTSDLLHGDTDADSSDTLTVTTYSHTSATDEDGGSASTGNSNSGTAGTDSVVGYYGTLTLAADGTYTYAADQSVTDALDVSDTVTDVFTYTLSDGTASDTGTLTITITGVNDAPVAVDDTDSVQVSNTVTDTTNSAGSVLSDDTDADTSSSLVVATISHGGNAPYVISSGTNRVNGQSITGTYGTLKIGADGTYSYVAGSSAGSDVFTYIVSDGNGGTDTGTLTITVSNGNPPVGVNDTDSVNEDATVTQSSGASLLVADDTDADGNSLTVSQIAVTGGSNSAVSSDSTYNSSGTQVTGTYGQLTVGADGSYTYVANQSAADTLDAGDTETDSFTYTVSDGTNTDTATLVITVTGVNDVPTASDNTVTTTENTPYVFSTSDFGYTDADDDDALVSVKITTLEDDGALQYYNGTTWTDVTLNQVITATDISNGYLRLNPDANEDGSPYTTFAFTVNDGDADSATPNTMTINVTNTNDAPVADNETNTATEGTTTTVTDGVSDVLAGDTDPDSDTLTVSAIRTGTEAAGTGTFGSVGASLTGTYGTLTIQSDGTYTYTPNDSLGATETGIDYFTYTVSDGNGGTDTGQITITVTGINDDPVANNDTGTVSLDNSSTTTGNLITNDTDADDSATLTVTACGQGQSVGSKVKTVGESFNHSRNWGNMTINSNGSYSFVAVPGIEDLLDPGESVTIYFWYTVSDGTSTSSSTIAITIERGNDAKTLNKPQFKDVRKQIKELPPAEPVADITKTVAEVRANKLQLETVVNNAELPKTEKVLQVNEGLKLVDLVAETGSFSISSNTPESTQFLKTQEGQSSDLVNLENLLQTNDKNNLKVRVNPDDALKLKFGVFNESSNEVVRYEGKMPDGSKLPDWIKVNPRNGKVTTVVPKDVNNIEFVVVATDTNNDQREIKVKIDPQQLAKDKTLFKRAEKIAKKVPDQSTSIIVNESGQANLIQQDKVTKQIDKVATNILNSNSSDISINDLNISDIISSMDSVEKLNQTQMMKSGKVEFTITKEFLGNFNDIKIVLSDGKDLPAWAKFDPETGTMIILPPDGQKELKLKMIINNNGEITVKDLEIKIVKETDPNNKNAELPDQHFTSFKDQIAMQNADWDDYGDNLIKRI